MKFLLLKTESSQMSRGWSRTWWNSSYPRQSQAKGQEGGFSQARWSSSYPRQSQAKGLMGGVELVKAPLTWDKFEPNVQGVEPDLMKLLLLETEFSQKSSGWSQAWLSSSSSYLKQSQAKVQGEELDRIPTLLSEIYFSQKSTWRSVFHI